MVGRFLREFVNQMFFLYQRFMRDIIKIPSLKLTFSPLKMDGWNTTFLLGRPILSLMLVSGRIGVFSSKTVEVWSLRTLRLDMD